MKRSFLCLFSIVIFTLSTSTALADVVPGSQFCMDHAATCGVWPDAETTCETWWSEAAIGEDTDTAGATQGCYNYHLAVAMEHLALGETETVIAHCAHSIGGEDAEGNAPCVDAVEEPVLDCDPACVDGEECVDGECLPVAPPVDDCDPACAEGETCVDGQCVAEPGPPDDGPFSINDCWNEQCVAETEACKAEPDCAAYNECYKTQDFDCQNALAESNPGAVELHQALRECGWQSCNDPSAGSCADPGKPAQDGTTPDNRCGQWDDNWPCNCDDACTQYNDCCDDFNDVCGGSTGGGDGGGGTGPCVPQCIGKSCGPDTCGGSCGACQTGQACSAAGVCEASCEDACALTDPGSCEGNLATICQQGASGCLELITDDCAAKGESCAGEGVCIPGAGDGTTPGTGGSVTGEGDDGDGGSSSAACAGGPTSSGTPFLVLLVLAIGALVRRRTLA